MARLLAAEGVSALANRIEHVAVADLGLDHFDVVFGHRDAQPEVAHHGCHEGVASEFARLLHSNSKDGHDLVTIHDGARVVDREATVGVAVVGDSGIRAIF